VLVLAKATQRFRIRRGLAQLFAPPAVDPAMAMQQQESGQRSGGKVRFDHQRSRASQGTSLVLNLFNYYSLIVPAGRNGGGKWHLGGHKKKVAGGWRERE